MTASDVGKLSGSARVFRASPGIIPTTSNYVTAGDGNRQRSADLPTRSSVAHRVIHLHSKLRIIL